MNASYVKLLLEGIENYSSSAETEDLAPNYMALLLAFNLQDWPRNGGGAKTDPSAANGLARETDNVILQLLSQAQSTTYFVEKLLLLFNREGGPCY